MAGDRGVSLTNNRLGRTDLFPRDIDRVLSLFFQTLLIFTSHGSSCVTRSSDPCQEAHVFRCAHDVVLGNTIQMKPTWIDSDGHFLVSIRKSHGGKTVLNTYTKKLDPAKFSRRRGDAGHAGPC